MDRGHFIKKKHLHPAKLSEPRLLKFALFSTEVAKYSESFKKEAIPFEKSSNVYIAGSVEIFLHFSTEFYYFTELKTYHLSYSIYKHDAIDIADPSSIQDA